MNIRQEEFGVFRKKIDLYIIFEIKGLKEASSLKIIKFV